MTFGDLRGKVPVIKISFGKEAEVSKSLRFGDLRYDIL